ncbi:hypothetical protein PYCC9005_005791 [Savitreella phatthalungensis]
MSLHHTVHHHADDEGKLGARLSELTAQTTKPGQEAHDGILAPAHQADHPEHPHSLSEWTQAGVAKLEDYAALYHWGNWVIDRKTKQKTFEQMPLYVRMGMHLLYVGGLEEAFLKNASFAQRLFIRESISMGKYFDSMESRSKIPGFVKSFNLCLGELEQPDLDKYENFNAFFSRALKHNARPIHAETDPRALVTAADCRCVVFNSICSATQLWIKGRDFTIASLLGDDAELSAHYEGGQMAIFRLAPADYHRWHSPVAGTVQSVREIDGSLMTVNPMAINEDLNVFTRNKRSVCLIQTEYSRSPVVVVAIGAMLVGSIKWLCKEGDSQAKGQVQGYFQYGGSTVIVLFPSSMDIKFDQDLLENSESKIETIVKVGESLGRLRV